MVDLAEPEAIDCPLGRVTLHGVTAGEGPLALLFHGITANGYVFAPLMAGLADAFRLVSVDQRGHGRSSKPHDGYAARDFAGDIAGLVRFFGGRPALAIGHSLGARNALVAGERFPELVAAVVAIEFTPYIETEVFDELDARIAGGDRWFPDLAAVRAYLADRYPLLPADAVDRRARFGYAASDGGYRPLADPQAMRQIAAGLREDLASTLTAIRVPTLLIRGAGSKLVSPAAWEKTRSLRPDLRAVELSGADHYVPEEVPDAVASEIRRWSATIRPGVRAAG